MIFSAVVLLVLSVGVLFYLMNDSGLKQNSLVVNTLEANTSPVEIPESVITAQIQPSRPYGIALIKYFWAHVFCAGLIFKSVIC